MIAQTNTFFYSILHELKTKMCFMCATVSSKVMVYGVGVWVCVSRNNERQSEKFINSIND